MYIYIYICIYTYVYVYIYIYNAYGTLELTVLSDNSCNNMLLNIVAVP